MPNGFLQTIQSGYQGLRRKIPTPSSMGGRLQRGARQFGKSAGDLYYGMTEPIKGQPIRNVARSILGTSRQEGEEQARLLSTNFQQLSDEDKQKAIQYYSDVGVFGLADAGPTAVGRGASRPISKAAKKIDLADLGKPVQKRFKGFTDLTTKSLKKLRGSTKVDREHLLNLANQGELKQAERDLLRRVANEFPEGKINVQEFADRVKTELLPLEVPIKASKYENVTLSDELRGPVANYYERIYQSPIKTSAGDVHFSGVGTNMINSKDIPVDNYFAHTRIEDLVDNQTRRVIEAQSDLFQKGRLEQEFGSNVLVKNTESMKFLTPAEQTRLRTISDRYSGKMVSEIPKEIVEEQSKLLSKVADARTKEVSLFQPYRNTWHERLIKEEVKQAAADGKTKLQFPTGETAMKIEGLGDADVFEMRVGTTKMGDPLYGIPKPEELEVGKEILRDGSDPWIITEVLGDGKFKAINSTNFPTINEDVAKGDFSMLKGTDDEQLIPMLKSDIENFSEQFDISGKVDTNNPIYKFYEKQIQRYLKNRYGAKTITDPQGVSWVEIDIKPEYGKTPIEAFGIIPILSGGQRRENQNSLQTR